MAVIASDILIKTMIESAFADLRKNSWILDDIFSGLATDPLAKSDFGYKEVLRAKQWFLENRIDVYLMNRIDNPAFPCITIAQTSSVEAQNRTSLADDILMEEMDPGSITKQVQKITPEFTPKSYNKADGLITLPKPLTTDQLAVNQYMVAKRSGKAYVIKQIVDDVTFMIAENINDDFTDGYVVPFTSLWNVHRELSFLDESFGIGLHTQSDINQAIWLRQLMMYVFLRYKEAFLEARGFEISTFNVGSIDENPHFQGVEKIYSCPLTLSGVVQVDWIKFVAPKLQSVSGGIRIIDGPKTPDQYEKEVKMSTWKMENDD